MVYVLPPSERVMCSVGLQIESAAEGKPNSQVPQLGSNLLFRRLVATSGTVRATDFQVIASKLSMPMLERV